MSTERLSDLRAENARQRTLLRLLCTTENEAIDSGETWIERQDDGVWLFEVDERDITGRQLHVARPDLAAVLDAALEGDDQ